MSHSLIKIWIHLVFGTKNRVPMIDATFEQKLYFFLQNQNYSVAEIAKNVKGNSSHWVNQNNFTRKKFAWQTGYGAFSVSESAVGKVRNYIKNQKEHHRKLSFAEEYRKFEEKYGFVAKNR